MIIAGGAPGEEHQIGLLMLVVMMRWRGWDIKYLGPNCHLIAFGSMAPLNPRMLLFSATTKENANKMLKIAPLMRQFPEPYPVVIFGGQGFKGILIPDLLKAIVVDATPEETVANLENLLEKISAGVEPADLVFR